MKYGLCTSMVSLNPNGIGIEFASTVKRLGYDYIELPLAELSALSDLEFSELRSFLNNLELTCEACNNFFPKSFRLTGPNVDLPAIREYIGRALERAAQLQTNVVVFGSGAAKRVPEGFAHERAFEQLVSLLQDIDRTADQYGVTIALEPLESRECNIINTFKEAGVLATASRFDHIRVLADYYHMTWERESPRILVEKSNLLAHVHFSCPYRPGVGERVAPAIGDGWNYDDFFSALKEAEYNGRISIEAYSRDVEHHAKDALVFLKGIFSNEESED